MLRAFLDRLRAVLAGRFDLAPETHRRGRRGEEMAARWLASRLGWTTVARNWRSGRGELDLVMRAPDGLLIFVEVRGRAAHARVGGFASITPRKRRVLRRTAEAYRRKLRDAPARWRFDVMEILWHGEAAPEVRHHVNVRI
jgi:putative endonuclease